MNKLAIFDMDGLLVDSEPLQIKSYTEVFKSYGIEITKEEYIREWIQGGKSVSHYVERYELTDDKNKAALIKKIRDEKKAVYEVMIKEELKLKEGVISLLESLQGKMDAVIASSSRIESIELITKLFGIDKFFKKLYSGSEHPKPKPYPDTFFEIAKEMHYKPYECVVLEDAEKGLIAAKRAGMKCIVCPDELTMNGDFSDADMVIDSLKELDVNKIQKLASKKA